MIFVYWLSGFSELKLAPGLNTKINELCNVLLSVRFSGHICVERFLGWDVKSNQHISLHYIASFSRPVVVIMIKLAYLSI